MTTHQTGKHLVNLREQLMILGGRTHLTWMDITEATILHTFALKSVVKPSLSLDETFPSPMCFGS